MQKCGLWREKVDKQAKNPEIQGFYPHNLWKTTWKMWNSSGEICGIGCDLCIAYSTWIMQTDLDGIVTGIYFDECLFEIKIHVILYSVKIGRAVGDTYFRRKYH